MNPEELLNAEKVRLGRELTPEEEARVLRSAEGMLQHTGEAARGATRERARLSRAAADESNAVDRSGGMLSDALERVIAGARDEEGGRVPAIADWLESGTSIPTAGLGGFTASLADEMGGAMASPRGGATALDRLLGGHAASVDPANKAALGTYDARRDELRNLADRDWAANPRISMASALGGGLAAAPLTPGLTVGRVGAGLGGVARGAGAIVPRVGAATRGALPRMAAAGATAGGYGALSGAGESREETLGGIASDAARAGLVSAPMGVGMGALAEVPGALMSFAPGRRSLATEGRLASISPDRPGRDRLVDRLGGSGPHAGRREVAAETVREILRDAGVRNPFASSGEIAEAIRTFADAEGGSMPFERMMYGESVPASAMADAVGGAAAVGERSANDAAAMAPLRAAARRHRATPSMEGPMPPVVVGADPVYGPGPGVPGPEEFVATGDLPTPAADELGAYVPPPRAARLDAESLAAPPPTRGERADATLRPERGPAVARGAARDAMEEVPEESLGLTGIHRRPGPGDTMRRGVDDVPPPLYPEGEAALPRTSGEPIEHGMAERRIADRAERAASVADRNARSVGLDPDRPWATPPPGLTAPPLHTLPIEPLPATTPVSRPRGERPAGARPVTGEWRPTTVEGPRPPPAPRLAEGPRPAPSIPFSAPGRPPGTAAYELRSHRRDMRAPATVGTALEDAHGRAQHSIRDVMDESFRSVHGEEELARYRAARHREELAIPAEREAARAAAAEGGRPLVTPRDALSLILSSMGGAAGGGVTGAVAAPLTTAGIVGGMRLLSGSRGRSALAAGRDALAAGLESRTLAGASEAGRSLAPAAASLAGRTAGRESVEEPAEAPEAVAARVRARRATSPTAPATVEPATTPTETPEDVAARVRARRTRRTP